MLLTYFAVALTLLLQTGCEKPSAHAMDDAELKRAKSIVGYWTSTDENIGFVANLNADGSGLLVYGSPLKSVKGLWWVQGSPERIVLRDKDDTLSEIEIVHVAADTMTVKDGNGGKPLVVKKAKQIGPTIVVE